MLPVKDLKLLSNEMPLNIQEWLAELTVASEPECTSILYAKSLLEVSNQQHSSIAQYCDKKQAQRIHVGCSSPLAPVKPQRCIARMMSSSSEHVMTASTPTPMDGEKYRTMVQYSLGDAQFMSTSAPTTPCSSRYASAPVSAFICVQSDKFASSNDNSGKTFPILSECDCVTCQISGKMPCAPVVPLRSVVASRVRHRSLTPKFSTRGRGQRRAVRHRPQKPHRLQLQPQQQLQKPHQAAADAVRKAKHEKELAANETVAGDSLSDASLCSIVESALKLDVDQWIAEDNESATVNDQREHFTCSSSQPNLVNESPYILSKNDDVDYNAVVHKYSDCFPCDDCDGSIYASRNLAAQRFPRNNLPPLAVPSMKSKKSTNSLQKKVTARKRSDSADSCDLNQLSCAERIRLLHKPPNYWQWQIFRVNGRTTSQILLNEPPTKSFASTSRYCDDGAASTIVAPPGVAAAACDLSDSGSNSSVDSGQGSAELSSQSYSSRDRFDHDHLLSGNSLPSYARMASTMDHALRVCSALHTVLNDEVNEKWTNDLMCKAKVLIATVQCSPCCSFLPAHDIATVQQMMCDLETERNCTKKPVIASNFLIVMLRKVIQEVLLIFARIISAYLSECTNKDRLLVIALEHLIHLMLFGDELCLVTIQCGGLDSILLFCEMASTPNGTLRLLLRALAVLCGNYRGALKLLTLGRFELIIHLLCTSSVACSAEAAGVLTQLTNPSQNYVQLGAAMLKVVTRILEIVDESSSSEPLLLAVAALANITVQETKTVSVLYEHNAIKRLVQAYKRPKCRSIFVQEQLLTVFTCLANEAYIEALIGQGAVPALLSMLGTRDSVHADYCKRTQLRAAQCLQTIATHGMGLKAIHQLHGYSVISDVMRKGYATSDATSILLWIRERLEQKYHLESAV